MSWSLGLRIIFSFPDFPIFDGFRRDWLGLVRNGVREEGQRSNVLVVVQFLMF